MDFLCPKIVISNLIIHGKFLVAVLKYQLVAVKIRWFQLKSETSQCLKKNSPTSCLPYSVFPDKKMIDRTSFECTLELISLKF